MSLDPIQRRLALYNARRARAFHADADGRCEHCRAPWPCEAAYRAELACAVLAPAAIGRARVHPDWIDGTPLGEQSDGDPGLSDGVQANRP